MVRIAESTRGICGAAIEMVEEGRLAPEYRDVAQSILDYEQVPARGELEKIFSRIRQLERLLLDGILGTAKSTPSLTLFQDASAPASEEGEAPLSLFQRMAFTRTKRIAKPLEMLPNALEATLFRGLEASRNIPLEDGSVSTLTRVRAILSTKIASQILSKLSRGDGSLIIPPPPFTAAFDSFLIGRGLTDQTMLTAWKDWPFWKSVLVPIFNALLIHGTIVDPERDPIEDMTQAIDLKRRWFQELISHDISIKSMEGAARFHGARTQMAQELRALAELRRFHATAGEARIQDEASAVQMLLASDIRRLHDLDPFLSDRDMLRLLPHYVQPMNEEALQQAFQQKGLLLTNFQQYQARMLLEWHLAPADRLVAKLAHMVERNVRYASLGEFCDVMLRLSEDRFVERMQQIAEGGSNVTPLLTQVHQKFPEDAKRLSLPLPTPAAPPRALPSSVPPSASSPVGMFQPTLPGITMLTSGTGIFKGH